MVTVFANGVKMILSRGDQWWHGSCGVRYEGTEGWVAVADGYSKPEVSSPALLADFSKLVKDYMARTERPMSHVRNFFDCIKSRRLTVANPEVMHRSMSTVHAANICMWLKRDMKYDPVKEEFINDAEANRLRSRAMRAPVDHLTHQTLNYSSYAFHIPFVSADCRAARSPAPPPPRCQASQPATADQVKKLVAVLKSDASQKEKADACRELARIGTKDAVAPLAALLPDEKLSHMARYGLETIPSSAVDKALREAAGKLQGRLLVGVIGSIGVRRDTKAVKLLAKLLQRSR